MKWTTLSLRVVCWTARILALGMFMIWGAFFLDHVKEWFMHPLQASPPMWVWLAQLAHLAILVGLVALWRWPIGGSLVTILASLVFFGGLEISAGTADHRYLAFAAFFAITTLPALLTLACGFAHARQRLPENASARGCS
jgi:hypothetical protein